MQQNYIRTIQTCCLNCLFTYIYFFMVRDLFSPLKFIQPVYHSSTISISLSLCLSLYIYRGVKLKYTVEQNFKLDQSRGTSLKTPLVSDVPRHKLMVPGNTLSLSMRQEASKVGLSVLPTVSFPRSATRSHSLACSTAMFHLFLIRSMAVLLSLVQFIRYIDVYLFNESFTSNRTVIVTSLLSTQLRQT